MKNQAKTVYLLTIAAVAAFCVMACVWLSAQYRASLRLQADHVYADVLDAMKEQQKIRQKIVNLDGHDISVAMRMQYSDSAYVDAYVINRKEMAKVNRDTVTHIDMSKYGKIIEGMERKRFDVEGLPTSDEVHLASSQYISNINKPFTAELLDSILQAGGIFGAEIDTLRTDSMMWNPERRDQIAFLDPCISVTVPYDTFNRACAVIKVPLRSAEVLAQMWTLLLLTVLVALLLVYCLVYQLSTIRRLREVDRLREEMMHRLIQERLREQSQGRDGQFHLGRLTFDTNNNCILDGDEATHLTVRQCDILSLLTENLGSIVPRTEILNTIWGDDSTANSLSLNVQLSHLRKMLAADPSVTIVTVKGKGLMMNVAKGDC